MLFGILDRDELLGKLQGINSWIEENKDHVGNANMYEIMACMLARNNIRMLEGGDAFLDAEIEKMIELRKNSIEEFLGNVPGCSKLFYEVRGGLTVDTIDKLFDARRNCISAEAIEKMDFICKAESVPFFINNTRMRGFDGDITMSIDEQLSRTMPGFRHDNEGEVRFLAEQYEKASDIIKGDSYRAVKWVIDNSIDRIKDAISISPIETEYGK